MNTAYFLRTLFVLSIFNGYAQKDKYGSLDTVIEYTDGITQEIHLCLTDKNQGIYWNTLPKNHQLHALKIFAKNNTGKPIRVIRIPNPDGRISFFGNGNTILNPGESLVVSVKAQFAHTSFFRPLDIQYETDGVIRTLHVPTWGIMDENYIRKTVAENPENYESVKPGFPLIEREGNRIITYNQSRNCVSHILQTWPDKRIEYFYDSCKLVAARTECYLKDRTYSITEEGVFENDTLKSGKRNVFYDRTHLSYSVNVVNGKNTDTIFHGRTVNKYDSSGQKTGYWILTGAQCDYSVNWQQALDCDVCMQLHFPGNKQEPDTIFVYDLNGRIAEMKFFSADSVFRITRRFHPNGFKLSELYTHTDHSKHEYFSIFFSSTVPGERTRKNYSDQTELFYENGKVVRKVGPKYGYKMTMEMPVEFLIPYTEEIGTFKGEKLYNGKIEYYDTFSKLIRVEKVLNGKVIR